MTNTTLKEIPILFSTEMVKAILEGRKTQTRRVVKPPPPSIESVRDESGTSFSIFSDTKDGVYRVAGPVWAVKKIMSNQFSNGYPQWKCPYGKPGDILWVRETFYSGYVLDDNDQITDDSELNYWYFADTRDARPADMSESKCAFLFGNDKRDWPHWKPSIHMPKAAARIWLQVESISIERVQDISEDDAIAEGVFEHEDGTYKNYFTQKGLRSQDGVECLLAKGSFQSQWCKINGLDSWNANPWVWVVKFKVLSTTGKPEIVSN